MGWICAPRRIVEKLVLMKQAADLHSPSINQMAILHVAETSYAAQVETVRRVYGERRNAILAALQASMPNGVAWSRPEGGMFIWVTLPDGIDTTAFWRARWRRSASPSCRAAPSSPTAPAATRSACPSRWRTSAR